MARSHRVEKPLLSREFVAALGGLGLTLFSWYSSWEWPAWPALKTMSTFFGNSFGDLSFNARAAVLVGLIILNAGTWAIGFWLLIFGGGCAIRRIRQRSSSSEAAG